MRLVTLLMGIAAFFIVGGKFIHDDYNSPVAGKVFYFIGIVAAIGTIWAAVDEYNYRKRQDPLGIRDEDD